MNATDTPTLLPKIRDKEFIKRVLGFCHISRGKSKKLTCFSILLYFTKDKNEQGHPLDKYRNCMAQGKDLIKFLQNHHIWTVSRTLHL